MGGREGLKESDSPSPNTRFTTPSILTTLFWRGLWELYSDICELIIFLQYLLKYVIEIIYSILTLETFLCCIVLTVLCFIF